MESSFQNSVSDFDLNFLNNVPRKVLILNPKEKKDSLAYLKKKVLLTDFVIRKYKGEKKLLTEAEKSLMESRAESRNLSIEKQNLLQNCNSLENEVLKLQIENKQLQERGFIVETQHEALKSHIKQLQVLVADYETQIQTFKIEAKLHKDTTLSHERKINNQKKENDTLIKHISILRDVIKKNKKVNKTVQSVLDKYNNPNKYPESEPESVADSSEHFEDAITTYFSEDSYDNVVIPQQVQETTKTTENKFKCIADDDTNIKSINSVDTGRGSSLAFSDGGKSFHSPDYYMVDSPLDSVIISSKNLKSYKDGATSPMLINKQCRSVSTSPIPTRKACHDRGTSPVPIHRRSVATSPVIFEIIRDTVNTMDRGASPIKILECVKVKEKKVNECRDVAVDTTSLVSNITTPPRISAPRERECLERNNSLTVNEDCQSDSEIQLILGEMKLHKRLTPIPSTPFKSSSARSFHTVSNLSNIEESLFDKLGPETIVQTKTLADMFNMVINEAIPHLVSGQVNVRKQEENTCDCRRESDAKVLNNTSESRQNDSLNITEVHSELEEQHNSNSDLTENNYTATISESTQNNSSNTNEENSDSEHCVEFEEQQISDSDFVNSMSHLESKTGNDNQLEKVPSQQTKTIDSEHCVEFEEQQISDSDFVNNMSHLESKTGNDNQLEQVLSQQTKTIDSEHCVEFEEQQISDSDLVNSMSHLESKTSNDNQLEQVLSQQTKTIDSELCVEFEEQQISDSDFVNSMNHLESKTGNDNQLEQVQSQQTKTIDSEHCVEFEEQQISDSDLVNSMSHLESKTSNDNQLEQVLSQQTKTIDSELCVEFEEQQISESDFVNSMNHLESKTGNDNQLEQVPSQQTKTIDSEYCVKFEEQQISDNDLVNSMSHFESKTGDNQLEQVPRLQTKTIDDADANKPLQMKDPNYNDTKFSKKLKHQEVVDNSNQAIVLSKTRKKKKLTNLDKIRKRLTPKSKIKESVPVRKLLVEPKQLSKNTLLSTKIRDSDTSASLNDKQVYEKAVKVMTELKAKQSERKCLTVIVEDCLKVKDKYASRRSSEVNIQNTVLDTILKSQAQILKPAAKSTDDCQNLNNSVNTTSTELKRRTKRNSSDAPTEVTQATRTLRPRRQSKTNDSLSDGSNSCNENKKNPELNSVQTTVASIINSVEIANEKIGKRKRIRTSRYDSTDSEGKECKASPAKRITVIEEQNYVPATINKRILRSSLRQENDDKINNVSSQSNNGCKNSSDDGESLLNDYYTVPNKRSPRISRCDTTSRKSSTETKLIINSDETKLDKMIKDNLPATTEKETKVNKEINKVISDEHTKQTAISYSDLDLFSTEPEDTQPPKTVTTSMAPVIHPKESVLCLMIEKYGNKSVHFYAKKPLESVTDKIHQKLEKEIEKINGLHYNEAKLAMIKLIMEIQYWDIKDFIVGLMKYLKDPSRKTELFSAIVAPPAPPATKSEQVLLYIIADLRYSWENVDLVCDILNNIEYHLFSLNRTPDFNTIESMSHFYAMLCRYYHMSSRVRLFILDALYCIQFKAIPLIKQCLDVWMHILPLAHMSTAQTPLVTCLVYLLHFYKCEDKFDRIHGLRMILKRKYFYDVNDWNEPKILEMIKTSIKGLSDIPVEIKMLRLALLIISKRQGPKWCLKNIIIGILQPMIDKNNISNRVKLFCISMLGPLLKPFPNDMKVHCEVVVNKLMDMLDRTQSQETLEAIYSSLIHISKHNEMRLHKYLLKWNPQYISREFEAVLRDYVKSKSIKVWKFALRNCHSSF